MMNNDLVEKAREYAKHDEYAVTRNYINALCLEIDRLRTLNKDVFGRIQDNTEVYADAERYRWLRSASWDVDTKLVAPSVIACNGDMSEWRWMIGNEIDVAIDKFLAEGK
jgi:hypothetical protein